jgi:hypothetical protein
MTDPVAATRASACSETPGDENGDRQALDSREPLAMPGDTGRAGGGSGGLRPGEVAAHVEAAVREL